MCRVKSPQRSMQCCPAVSDIERVIFGDSAERVLWLMRRQEVKAQIWVLDQGVRPNKSSLTWRVAGRVELCFLLQLLAFGQTPLLDFAGPIPCISTALMVHHHQSCSLRHCMVLDQVVNGELISPLSNWQKVERTTLQQTGEAYIGGSRPETCACGRHWAESDTLRAAAEKGLAAEATKARKVDDRNSRSAVRLAIRCSGWGNWPSKIS